MPSSFKETGEEEDRLGRYKWVKGYGRNIIKYYLEHKRFACIHAQARHGLIPAMCVSCAEHLGKQ
jgi:hypothetical protein